ncbi:MAG: FHA domain-containing protein [Deltaproteobacteria bacterium]|nr:FHA domain-containing protein [Deltaproteobacteria bacterium]MBN2672537.1 FHA domain-containing protein [Deltaproteobacteria bacterium]
MTVKAGIVCGNCDQLNTVESRECSECGSRLELSAATTDTATSAQSNEKSGPQDAAQDGKEDESMEQARHLVCGECYTPVPAGHKFCGKCGNSLESNVIKDPNYFGDLQSPGKAKLILIKGEGVDGMSYHLNSTEHLAGRTQGEIVFQDDQWLSPAHANFVYQDDKIFVQDQNSLNGIFIAITQPKVVAPGSVFMVGEQVFRVEEVAPVDQGAEPDGTYFFSSPFTAGSFRVVQILEGGGDGMIVNPKETKITIGREDCDMNFPADPFISGKHVQIESTADGIAVTDLNSKNGTFLKVNKETELVHGDYLFLGRQLLRVEITQ